MARTASLSVFVRSECANYAKDTCLFRNGCLVLDGKRCGYFEKGVLGPVGYKFQLPQYDYEKLYEAYGSINTNYWQGANIRRCECGEMLLPRRKLCGKCKRKRRLQTKRENQRNFRVQRSTV